MKRAILITVSVLLVLGLIGYSAYVYEYYRQPSPTLTTAQAVKQRNDAVQRMQLHDSTNKTNVDNLNKQVSDTQAKLTSVCASLKAVSKTPNTYCP